MHANAILGQKRCEIVAPERVLGSDQFVRGALNGIERFRGAHAVGADVTRLAFDLLFDAGDANFEKLVEVRAKDGENFTRSIRAGRILRLLRTRRLNSTNFAILKFSGAVSDSGGGGTASGMRNNFVAEGGKAASTCAPSHTIMAAGLNRQIQIVRADCAAPVSPLFLAARARQFQARENGKESNPRISNRVADFLRFARWNGCR